MLTERSSPCSFKNIGILLQCPEGGLDSARFDEVEALTVGEVKQLHCLLPFGYRNGAIGLFELTNACNDVNSYNLVGQGEPSSQTDRIAQLFLPFVDNRLEITGWHGIRDGIGHLVRASLTQRHLLRSFDKYGSSYRIISSFKNYGSPVQRARHDLPLEDMRRREVFGAMAVG